jgi:HEAT repeats
MKPLVLVLAAAPLFAQPHLSNARMETRAVTGSLDATFRAIVNAQSSPAWIGYAAPRVPGSEGDGTCQAWLEPGNMNIAAASGTVHLEGAAEFYVFFRVENKQVDKIRTFSIDCAIDAGGLPFFWLTGVNPAQSVALLEPFASLTERRMMNNVVSAIALHRDASADAALDRFSAPSEPEETRRQATFWLGNARGRHGYESLLRILRDDPSDRVREHAVFALTQSKEPEAIPAVVRVAHEDKSTRVRGQALFWLAQRASKQISEDAIRHAIDQDPDTEVKKKAVFALTQMHDGEGVPLLIEIARTNKNAAVKKQAMFWLGQSRDPRALKFFEDLLATH